MRLADALRIRSGMAVAFVGAGGKSSAMRKLVEELSQDIPLIVTTTTKLGVEQSDLAASHAIITQEADMDGFPELLDAGRSLLVTGPRGPGQPKWLGLGEQQIERVWRMAHDAGAVLLIEADGARRRALKAPAEHEPAIPPFVDLIVPIAGIDAMGASLADGVVHRPELLAGLLELEMGIELSAQHIADALTSPEGGLKSIPEESDVRLLINKVETAAQIEAGREIAQHALKNESVRSVVLAAVAREPAALEIHGRVAGVVLAAGASTRLKRPKQLVRWRGRPLVWHALHAAKLGGLGPIIVVLGAEGEEVRRTLDSEDVIFIDNPDWQQGQGTSVRVGLSAVSDQVEAAVFLLSDMPLVGSELVQALVEKHRRTLAPIIVPQVGERRANPVLFDRAVFSELLSLRGDVGGRALFNRFSIESLDWPEDVFLDIDTVEDLRRLEELE